MYKKEEIPWAKRGNKMCETIEKPTKIPDCHDETYELCEHRRRWLHENYELKTTIWDLQKVIGKLRTQIEKQWEQMDFLTAERNKRLKID